MLTLTRRFRSRDGGDGGFTLVELLVVMVVLGVVLAIVTSATIGGMQATRRAHDRIQALADLQKGLERVGREVRAADPLIMDPGLDFGRRVGAEIFRDGKRYVYTYHLDDVGGGQFDLLEDVSVFALDGTLLETRDGLFIERVANDVVSPAVPVFQYFDSEGDEIGCADLDLSGDAGQQECVARHATASQIRVVLMKVLNEQDPVRAETVLNIRSTRYCTGSEPGCLTS